MARSSPGSVATRGSLAHSSALGSGQGSRCGSQPAMSSGPAQACRSARMPPSERPIRRAGTRSARMDSPVERKRAPDAGHELLRKEDVVVVTRLDRLARSTGDLLKIAEAIRAKDAGLLSLAEPWADTTSPAGRMVLTVFAGIAEFERELIRQRTDEGRQVARKRGVSFGRPSKLRPDQRELATRLLQEGRSVSEVARAFDVHPATIHRRIEMPVPRPRPRSS
jgi:Resolvase, N terminal domain/Helix-turn-helix domain